MSRSRALLANLLLSLAATVFFLGGLEGLCRLFEKPREAPAVAEYIWDWDQKWDGNFYTVSADAVGWPPWEEFNGDGLRDRTHTVEKPAGTLRVVVLGDSVTMGAGIEPQQAYPQVLQARLDAQGRPVEVFNVALWGWSTLQERLAYERLARAYRPDLVVLGVCLNDIPELQNNLARPPRFLQALHQRSALVRRIVNAQGREIGRVEELFATEESRQVREGWARFFDEVRALRDEAKRGAAGFALVVFPFRFQVTPGAPPPVAQERILAFCAAEKLTCLDLLPALRDTGPRAFVDYDHLSPAGSQLAADAILRSGLLPAGPSDAEVLGPRRAVPLSALRDPDARVRAAAARTLESTTTAPAAALLDAFRTDGDPTARAAEALALGALGKGASQAAPTLLGALEDPSEIVRAAAAQALWRIGLTLDAVPRLASALASPDSYVRGFAAFSLGELGPAAKDAVPALVTALGQDEAYGRGGAAAALAKMGPAARAAVPALLRGLASPEEGRRWRAARALGRIGPEAREAVPPLTRALSDSDERVRFQAARALGRIGPDAKSAVAALNGAARDGAGPVRREAQRALRRIAGAEEAP